MRAPSIVFNNAAGQVSADSAHFLRVTWHSTARTLADTQALFECLLQQLQARNWSRVLINQQALQPFSNAEQAWITTNWLPRAVRDGGYRHGALIVSASVLARLATAYITTHVQGLPLLYRSFDTEAEALAWLLQQPATP